jgi:hypothetical protein
MDELYSTNVYQALFGPGNLTNTEMLIFKEIQAPDLQVDA